MVSEDFIEAFKMMKETLDGLEDALLDYLKRITADSPEPREE